MSTKYVIITGDIAKECTISFFNNKRISLTLNMAVASLKDLRNIVNSLSIYDEGEISNTDDDLVIRNYEKLNSIISEFDLADVYNMDKSNCFTIATT